MHTRRAAFMRSLAAQAAWSKNYLHKVRVSRSWIWVLASRQRRRQSAPRAHASVPPPRDYMWHMHSIASLPQSPSLRPPCGL